MSGFHVSLQKRINVICVQLSRQVLAFQIFCGKQWLECVMLSKKVYVKYWIIGLMYNLLLINSSQYKFAT